MKKKVKISNGKIKEFSVNVAEKLIKKGIVVSVEEKQKKPKK